MKRVTLLAHQTGVNREAIQVPVSASITSSINKKTLSEVLAWVPILRTYGTEDADWDWKGLLREARELQRGGRGKYEGHVLRCQRQVQALMILESKKHVSRITGHPLIYLEYLAVAPWNRPDVKNPRRFSGCGSSLLRFAAERSQVLGYGGTLALHALPGSRPFYRQAGMKDFGPDSQEDGLHYFELHD